MAILPTNNGFAAAVICGRAGIDQTAGTRVLQKFITTGIETTTLRESQDWYWEP
jgi:hypothetical protein